MRANAEVVPVGASGPRIGSWVKWIAWTFAVVLVLVLVAAGVGAYQTNQFSQKYEGLLLPGTVIEGVNVSGMSPEEASKTVRGVIGSRLHHPIVVGYKRRRWTATPKELGARSNLRSVIQAAADASAETTFWDKARMHWLGEDLGFVDQVGIDYERKGVERFVGGIASGIFEEPVDARLDYSTGWVEVRPHETGREVKLNEAHAVVNQAMRQSDYAKVPLPVRVLQPEVTADEFDKVLLVRIGENRLYLYDDGRISGSWPVATGQPEYMTPTGTFSVTEKRYLPTWINPAPDTWGADLPAEIPPGPTNPLGLRAINWSAPAIRFHGTEATYSLGYNASHGCVRLANSDVIQLYDMIDVGTPIVSLVAAPLKPLYVSSPDPTPVPENQVGSGEGGGPGPDRERRTDGGGGDGGSGGGGKGSG